MALYSSFSTRHSLSRHPAVPLASAACVTGPCRRHLRLQVHAIGFDFGEQPGEAERRAAKIGNFGMRAASLLVCQNVFKGGVGEAFLGVIAASKKYQASNKEIVAAYSRFYQLLLTAGYDTWQDYVLDQLLSGRDNPLARAVAQASLHDNAPVLSALEYDLDVLQELSIDIAQLAEFIGDVAPTAGGYWMSAASSASTKGTGAQLRLQGSTSTSAQQPAFAININTFSTFIQRPPTADELAQWRAAIAAQQQWSAAAPLLQQYFHLHGFGITSRNSALRWSKGAFEEASPGVQDAPMLSANSAQRAAIAANTERHLQGLPAQHVVVCGPPGSGKSWLLWEALIAAGADKGLRVVDVPASELANILDIARGCARYPRVRFVLVADHVDLPLRGQVAADLSAGLSGAGASGWPSNTLLYLGASANSTVSYADPVVARCGVLVATVCLDEASFVQTLTELLPQLQSGSSIEQVSDQAVQWASEHGCLSLRTAAMYAQLLVANTQAGPSSGSAM